MNEHNFKEAREELNLSQQDAAVLINVSRVTYNKYEQEPDTMPIGKYKKLISEFERLRSLRAEG